MGILTINDCGTAHEAQLLEIYNGLIDKEKLVTGKEPTSLEKSNIELQVAEAYQSILTICNDGGQISKALELLKERVPTMSINEISKVAVDVVSQVSNVRDANENGINDIDNLAAIAALEYALGDSDGKQNEINDIPEEIPQARERIFEDLSSQVHEDGASIEDQSAMVAFSYGASMDTGAELGLKLSDLEFSDQCEVIKTIKDYLKYGDKEIADFYCKRYGITDADLENPEYESFDHLMDTVSPEEDKVMYEINKLAGSIRMLADYTDILSPELCEKEFERLLEEINASEYPVDAIFKAIDSSKRLSQNKEIYARFLDVGIEMFNNPNVKVDMDGWLLSYMVGAAKNFDESGSREGVEQVVELINNGLSSNDMSLTIDDVLNFDILSFQEHISDESRRTQSASECIRSYANKRGLDYRADRTIILDSMNDDAKQTDREPELSDPKLIEDFKIGIARAYKEGGDVAAHQCYEDFVEIYPQSVQDEVGRFVQDGGYRKIEVRETEKVDLKEQKRQLLEKMMYTVANGKGLARAQEVIEDLITRYPDKEIAIGATLSFLESQKDSNEQFMNEDSREAREGVFEAIVLTGVEEPEIFERMQKLDRDTSKVVVNKVLEQINDSRASINKVLGAVQMLGKNLNEKDETVVEDKPLGFLDPEKTDLPHIELFTNKEKDYDEGR